MGDFEFFTLKIEGIEPIAGIEYENLENVEGFALVTIFEDRKWTDKQRKKHARQIRSWAKSMFHELKQPRDMKYWNEMMDDVTDLYEFRFLNKEQLTPKCGKKYEKISL